MHPVLRTVSATLFVLVLPLASMAQSTHPRDFVALREELANGKVVEIPTSGLKAEIDRASDVLLVFDRGALVAAVGALGNGDMIEIRVEASITRAGATQSAPLEIDNYYGLVRDKSGTISDVIISDHAVINNSGEVTGFVPDAVIDLTSQALSPGDTVRLRITNLSTQESVDRVLTARAFGVIGEVKDSFFFLRRLRVSSEDTANGIDSVNFGPAPGVSYLWTVSPRRSGFWRTARPSVGMNVSFTDWNDPAFDQTTGQFVAGTKASHIELTAGGVFGMFDGIVQFTLGSNLNANAKRSYFGVGFSFVNVVDRLGQLIAER